MSKTVQDILNSNIAPGRKSPAQIKQLRQEAGILRSAANKRIARLEKAGIKSAALSRGEDLKLFNNGNRFSTKVPDKDLVSTINNMKKFLNWQTSTVTGARQLVNERIEALGIKLGKQASEKVTKDFWETYNKWKNEPATQGAMQTQVFSTTDILYRIYKLQYLSKEEEYKENPELIIADLNNALEEIQKRYLEDQGEILDIAKKYIDPENKIYDPEDDNGVKVDENGFMKVTDDMENPFE